MEPDHIGRGSNEYDRTGTNPYHGPSASILEHYRDFITDNMKGSVRVFSA